MEPRTKQQTQQHRREATQKRHLAGTPSGSAKTSEEELPRTQRRSKSRSNESRTRELSSTGLKAGAGTTHTRTTRSKRAKSSGRGGESGAALAARTRLQTSSAALTRSTATMAARKMKVTGQKSPRKKQTSFENEELTSLKRQLASTQEALQKVLQCYGVEFLPRSLSGVKGRETSKGTAGALVQRELHTLKRLLYLISGGQVPLPVPPDFFYVFTKQYLEGTWTDICAAAAKTATGALPADTKETAAAGGRTEVSIESVHEIPSAAERKALHGSATAALKRMESTTATRAQHLPAPGGVSAGGSSLSQIEEVEQCIRVEIEGEEPMEWRDVYRLPEEGPPVLVSSSANERACAAAGSGETLKREALEMTHEDGNDNQQLPPHKMASRSAEQKKGSNRSHVEQNEEQAEKQQEQQQDVVFTVQPQHAAVRTWNKGCTQSSQGSLTPREDENERKRCASSTSAGESLLLQQERRVTLPVKPPPQPGNTCRSSSLSCTPQQGLGVLNELRGQSSSRRSSTHTFPQTETRRSRRRPLPPWTGGHSKSMGYTDQEFRHRNSHVSMGIRHGYTYNERLGQENWGGIQQRAPSLQSIPPLNNAEVLSKVSRAEEIKEKQHTEEVDSAGIDAHTSIVDHPRAGSTVPQQQLQQLKVASSAAQRGGAATVAEQQPIHRKSESFWFAGSAQETPKKDKDVYPSATGRLYYGGRNAVGSTAPAQGQSGFPFSSRVRSISSSSSRNNSPVPGGQDTWTTGRESSSRSGSTQGRDSERSISSRTAAIGSLFSQDIPAPSSATAGGTERIPLRGSVQGGRRLKSHAFSERRSMSGDRSDSTYFIPAPGRRRDSGEHGGSVDVSAATSHRLATAVAAACRGPLQQQGQQQNKTERPLFVGGSASPLGRPLMKAAGAPELATVRTALASAATAATGAKPDTRTSYIFDVHPCTKGSPPQSAFYCTPPQLPASPLPSPVLSIFPTAAAAAATTGAAPERKNSISSSEVGHGKIFIPPSAAYPYGALVSESFAFPAPPPLPVSPVFGRCKADKETMSVPVLLAVASTVENSREGASVASSSQGEKSSILGAGGRRQQQQDDEATAATHAAKAAKTHKAIVEEEEKVGSEEEREKKGIGNGSDSERQKKQKHQEVSKNREEPHVALRRFVADAHAARGPHPPRGESKSRKQEDEQNQRSSTEAPASALRLSHPTGTPCTLRGSPVRGKEGGGAVSVNGQDITAADSSVGGYDEAAAAALQFRVYRHPARPGHETYDVFKTAAVQAVLLAHEREMFVPVFWNKDGAPVSWPWLSVSPATSAAGRHSPVSEEQQCQEPQRQKQQQARNAASTAGEEQKYSVFLSTVPGTHRERDNTQQINSSMREHQQQAPQYQPVEPLRFSPPKEWQRQRWGQMNKNGFSKGRAAVVSSRVAQPAAVSPPGGREDCKGLHTRTSQDLAGNLAVSAAAAGLPTAAGQARTVVDVAASAPLSATSSTISEDVYATPWCGFKHALLSSYSPLKCAPDMRTSACCAAAPSRPSSAKSRSASRLPVSDSLEQQQQQHQQQQWGDIHNMAADGPAADSRRSGRTTTVTHRMRRAPPDVVGTEQTAAGGDERARGARAWYAAASGLDSMDSAGTATTPNLFYWSQQESSKGSRASRKQLKTSAATELRVSDSTEPKVEGFNQEMPTCAATLEHLNSILKEASNLDARLKQVDGKVEKLLRARTRSRVIGS